MGSPTEHIRQVFETAWNVARGSALQAGAQVAGQVVTPKLIAKAMIDPIPRQALITITKAKGPTADAAGAMKRLGGYLINEAVKDEEGIQ